MSILLGTMILICWHFGGRIMLITNLHDIGANLLFIRKRLGFTQSEAAEKAGLSDRTYADIERGSVNMRVDTLLKICQTFHITPDEILTKEDSMVCCQEDISDRLGNCSLKERKTALELLSVYLKSLE